MTKALPCINIQQVAAKTNSKDQQTLELIHKNRYSSFTCVITSKIIIMKLSLKRLNMNFTVHRLPAQSDIPPQVFSAPIYFIAKTFEELSIVLPQDITIESTVAEADWQALQVLGPLDFALTGILSKIATILAQGKISIFAISTFDTDYILVKKEAICDAISILNTNDYDVVQ